MPLEHYLLITLGVVLAVSIITMAILKRDAEKRSKKTKDEARKIAIDLVEEMEDTINDEIERSEELTSNYMWLKTAILRQLMAMLKKEIESMSNGRKNYYSLRKEVGLKDGKPLVQLIVCYEQEVERHGSRVFEIIPCEFEEFHKRMMQYARNLDSEFAQLRSDNF